MNTFTFTYPTKVYFGEKVAAEALKGELSKVGRTSHAGIWRRVDHEKWHL